MIRSGLLGLCFVVALVTCGSAQSGWITHTTTTEQHAMPQLGRNLWFTMIQVGDDTLPEKYYELYVTSWSQTTIYVQMGNGPITALPVDPLTVKPFSIPLSWEVKPSGVVTKQAIHVWCDDADVSAYVMSHVHASADAMNLIPTIGWDTMYVVASYPSPFDTTRGAPDLPSEFAIVANQNGTVVTITPTADVRVESAPGACCSCLAHPKGVPFVITMERGEAVHFKTTCTLDSTSFDSTSFDFTGTVIHANKPIGVVSGSMRPQIPIGYPDGDHICEMMPGVRTWGETYVTAPFYPAGPGKQSAGYLVIGTEARQAIHRVDPNHPDAIQCILARPYESYFTTIDQPSRWYSDAPFMLVQYCLSSTYPDGIRGNGAPAMVVIGPVEQYVTFVLSHCAPTIPPEPNFISYVNMITKTSATWMSKFDGIKISSQPHMQIDGIWEISRLKGVHAGSNSIASDSGVGVYIYGYGTDEAYAYCPSFGNRTTFSPDTTAPAAYTTSSCYSAHVTLTDSGGVNSLLTKVQVDSSYNMNWSMDTGWQEGALMPVTGYSMSVADISRPAFLLVSAIDRAGCARRITSAYTPQYLTLSPDPLNAGAHTVGSAAVVLYDSIQNHGADTMALAGIGLVNGATSGFSIDSVVLRPIPPGGTRMVKLRFQALSRAEAYDTLVIDQGCAKVARALLLGNGRSAEFRLYDAQFGSVRVRDTAFGWWGVNHQTYAYVALKNLSDSTPIEIDSIWADSSEFEYVGPVPFKVDPGNESGYLDFFFVPQVVGPITSPWHAYSSTPGYDGKPLGVRSGMLSGNGLINGVAMPPQQAECTLAASVGTLSIKTPSDWTGEVTLELIDLLGLVSRRTSFIAGPTSTLDVKDLPAGAYLYRLSCGSRSSSGKLIITR